VKGKKMGPYNGYTGRERNEKQAEWHDRVAKGLPAQPPGPCSICADPTVRLEPHTEDYSKPFLWEPPAEYALCAMCHKNKLHMRFANPVDWKTWKAHVRRGGWSTDLSKPDVKEEIASYRAAVRKGMAPDLKTLRPRALTGTEWWESLSMDRGSLTDLAARPRP
jgi:hypothetical protein